MSYRLLHIITQLELGGAQKNVLDILSHLSGHEFEAYLVSSDGLLTPEARDICGDRLTLLPFFTRTPHPLFDFLAFFFLIFYMRRHKIQIVHTHSSKAGILGRWAAKCAGVAVIVHTVHGWGFRDHVKGFLNDFYIFLEQKTATITNRFIAVSECDIQRGLAHNIGTAGQYTLVRCGIARPAPKAPGVYLAKKHSLGLTQDDLVVGMVACLKPQKNPIDFIACAARVTQDYPQAKFLLVGDGALRPLVENEIDKRNLRDSVITLGWRKDVQEILAFMDVLVLTSLWEGLPLVVLEAMHFSRPVVAYDTCGISEIVEDGVNGFLVLPKDVEGLSAKIGLLLGDAGLRRRMGQFGRHMVSQDVFSHAYMASRMGRLYKEEIVRVGDPGNSE